MSSELGKSPILSDAAAVASPCVRHCCLDHHDICVGCYRTLAEILQWSGANNAEKRDILRKCQLRVGHR
jgi:predicted Fe-S protein YdhL (DUF1289 family)